MDMKKEMDLAEKLYKPHSTGATMPSETWMPRLWQKMMALYGRQWEASYGQPGGDVYKEWYKALNSLKTAHVKRGLDSVVEEGNEYPPNLIKFLRLCKTPPYGAFQTCVTALPKAKPHYSVMRIEMAKQKALTGGEFKAVKSKRWLVMNWNGQDEESLFNLISEWDKDTGYEGLNSLIDNHQFSSGKHSNLIGV